MATLGMVRDTLVALATSAVYPNGTGSASVTGKTVALAGGWPLPADIDTAMAAGASIVNVWPAPGATGAAEQLFEPPQVVSMGALGLSVSVNSPSSVTITGTPNVGEYVLVSLDHAIGFSYVAVANDTAASVANALATAIAANYPGTTAANGVISVVGAHLLEASNAAPGTIGQALWRQKQLFRVIIRSPNDADRNTLEGAIDPVFKASLRIVFPDASQGILLFQSVLDSDLSEKVGEYARTLQYAVTYSTNMTYVGYPVISVGMQTTSGAQTITQQT